MIPAIETAGLTKAYGASRGIVDVDLSVAPGEVFGFLGPNGAGKTTMIRLLLDLIRPTRGTARVLGLDAHADAIALHRRMGYVAGDPALDDRLTGRTLCAWLGRLRGVSDPAGVDALAERLDVDLDRPIRVLSRGNRQKVALVQAFVHRPDLLLLDEPTAGLDPIVQETFVRMVREVADDGRTVFLSSHRLDEVQQVCDRVGIIADGRLIAVDRVDELRARAWRTVEIEFAAPVDPSPFAALAGVDTVEADGTTLRLRAVGDLDALVKLAARHHVVDLVSEPPELEEIFLGYFPPTQPADERGGPDAR
ncbi:MAG: ATP-binding cassette domain-containing protein [Actinomycetota bacterium]